MDIVRRAIESGGYGAIGGVDVQILNDRVRLLASLSLGLPPGPYDVVNAAIAEHPREDYQQVMQCSGHRWRWLSSSQQNIERPPHQG